MTEFEKDALSRLIVIEETLLLLVASNPHYETLLAGLENIPAQPEMSEEELDMWSRVLSMRQHFAERLRAMQGNE